MLSSPLKLAPTSAKRAKTMLDWQKCIICQTVGSEKLYLLTEKGKESFVDAVELRRDAVYEHFTVEITSF